MIYKLTLTAVFILGFLSLGLIINNIASDSFFINKAFAGSETGSGGNGAGGRK